VLRAVGSVFKTFLIAINLTNLYGFYLFLMSVCTSFILPLSLVPGQSIGAIKEIAFMQSACSSPSSQNLSSTSSVPSPQTVSPSRLITAVVDFYSADTVSHLGPAH
jgi:hypothetical protein